MAVLLLLCWSNFWQILLNDLLSTRSYQFFSRLYWFTRWQSWQHRLAPDSRLSSSHLYGTFYYKVELLRPKVLLYKIKLFQQMSFFSILPSIAPLAQHNIFCGEINSVLQSSPPYKLNTIRTCFKKKSRTENLHRALILWFVIGQSLLFVVCLAVLLAYSPSHIWMWKEWIISDKRFQTDFIRKLKKLWGL